MATSLRLHGNISQTVWQHQSGCMATPVRLHCNIKLCCNNSWTALQHQSNCTATSDCTATSAGLHCNISLTALRCNISLTNATSNALQHQSQMTLQHPLNHAVTPVWLQFNNSLAAHLISAWLHHNISLVALQHQPAPYKGRSRTLWGKVNIYL